MTPEEEIFQRVSKAVNEVRASIAQIARVLSDDGPGPAYQLWKFGRLLEDESRERKDYD